MKNMTSKLSLIKLAAILLLSALFVLSATSTVYAGNPPPIGYVPPVNIIGTILGGISTAIGSAMAAAGALLNAILGPVAATLYALGLGPLWTVLMNWLFGGGNCGATQMNIPGNPPGIGQVICNMFLSTTMLPGFIAGIAYMIGLVCAVTGLVKLKDHVLDPHRVPLSDSMKRFVAGGAFFALPIITGAAQNLIYGTGMGTLQSYGITAFAASLTGGYGLDTMLIALVADILQPMMNLLGSFVYIAGLVLVVIGISRLLKTAQEGPRGPAGIGTIMTFVTAGILFSLGEVMGSFGASLFGDTTIETYGTLDQGTGDPFVDVRIESVITSVIVFMFLVGWISFIRGFFILRDVAEGNGQASLMAAMTHIFGGALAVNLGPVMNAVQSTFGLYSYGVTFN
jgi:hypothetical protein